MFGQKLMIPYAQDGISDGCSSDVCLPARGVSKQSGWQPHSQFPCRLFNWQKKNLCVRFLQRGAYASLAGLLLGYRCFSSLLLPPTSISSTFTFFFLWRLSTTLLVFRCPPSFFNLAHLSFFRPRFLFLDPIVALHCLFLSRPYCSQTFNVAKTSSMHRICDPSISQISPGSQILRLFLETLWPVHLKSLWPFHTLTSRKQWPLLWKNQWPLHVKNPRPLHTKTWCMFDSVARKLGFHLSASQFWLIVIILLLPSNLLQHSRSREWCWLFLPSFPNMNICPYMSHQFPSIIINIYNIYIIQYVYIYIYHFN